MCAEPELMLPGIGNEGILLKNLGQCSCSFVVLLEGLISVTSVSSYSFLCQSVLQIRNVFPIRFTKIVKLCDEYRIEEI